MCGFIGIVDQSGISGATREEFNKSRDLMAHRGPDDHGGFYSKGVWLGFRRLSILDLSPNGHQPMSGYNGRYQIVFNGEIYNYIELREVLKEEGISFHTNTDTEVILACYHKYGFDCVSKFNGMWGMAIWDAEKERLFCSRDRFGVKPFYYSYDGKCFVFASEIKSLLRLKSAKPRENKQRVYDYVVHGYLDHTAESLYEGIFQLKAGHSLILKDGKMDIAQHWHPDLSRTSNVSFQEARNHYRELFLDAVKIRMRSDVNQGILLSGGQDSSAIAGAITYLNNNGILSGNEIIHTNKLRSYSACYTDAKYDEQQYIDAVVKHLDICNVKVFPTDGNLEQVFLNSLWIHDEPLSTSNVLSHASLLERVRKDNVVVLLVGQGADEVLYGYDKQIIGYLLRDIFRSGGINRVIEEIGVFDHHRSFGIKYILLQTLKSYIRRSIWPSVKAKFFERTSRFLNRSIDFKYLDQDETNWDDPNISWGKKFSQSSLRYDSLPKIVHYEDRSAMAYSIEERFPFLDYRLVEFTLALRDEYLYERGITKRVLREAVSDLVPKAVKDRVSKIGFATPTGQWTRRLAQRASPDIYLTGHWLLMDKTIQVLRKGNYSVREEQFFWRVLNYLSWKHMFEVRD